MKKLAFQSIILILTCAVRLNAQVEIVSNNFYCDQSQANLIIEVDAITVSWEVDYGQGWVQIEEGDGYSGVNDDTLVINSVSPLLTDYLFRALIDTAGNAVSFYSEEHSIEVFSDIQLDSLLGGGVICYNSIPAPLIAPQFSGGSGMYSYQWYENGNILLNQTEGIFIPGELTNNTSYFVVVQDSCGSISQSNNVDFEVLDIFELGVLYGDDEICYNSTPNLLTAPIPLGGTGDYSYQWYDSNGVIPGANQSSYQEGELTESMSYYVEVNDNCGVIQSNWITISVLEDVEVGQLLGDQTICYNTAPSLFSAPQISGGFGNYSYQWKTNSLYIPSATNNTFQNGALVQDQQFSLIVTDECATIETNYIEITVLDEFSIVENLTGEQTLCYNGIPNEFHSPLAEGGGGDYSYQWKINSQDIDQATLSSYQSIPLTESSYFSVEISDVCGVAESNQILINILEEFIVEELEGGGNVCYNSQPELLIAPNISGGFGDYQYQWQVNDVQIFGATTNTYQPPQLTSDYSFSLTVSDLCGVVETDTVVYSVYNLFQVGELTGSQTICYNTAPSIILPPSVSGGMGYYSYQWMKDSSPISGAESPLLVEGELQESANYSVVVSDFCGAFETNNIQISVLDDLNPGQIIGDTSICIATSPSSIQFDLDPFGGGEGDYGFTWMESIDGVNFQELYADTGQTSILNTGNLLESTYYRVEVTSPYGCGPKLTNSVHIDVKEPFVAGVVNSETVCFNSQAFMEFNDLPTGGFESYNFQWEILDTQGENWINFGNNAPFVFTPYLQTDRIVRAKVSDVCGTEYTPSAVVNVHDELIAGSIFSEQTICHNTSLEQILFANYVPPSGGDLSYSYQWYESDNNDVFTLIDEEVFSTYNPGPLVDTKYYKVEYISGSNCGAVMSNVATVNVLGEVVPGSLSGNQTICYNTTPEEILLQADETIGGGDSGYDYTIQWSIDDNDYYDTSESIFFEEPTSLGEDLSGYIGDITTSLFFRVKTSSSQPFLCGPKYSNSVYIEVYDSLNPGALNDVPPHCYNTAPDSLYFTELPTGEGGMYYYTWLSQIDGGEWDTLLVDNIAYLPDNFLTSVSHKVVIESILCETEATTDPIYLEIYPELIPGTIISSDEICYNEIPNLLQDEYAVTGGNGIYTYSWYEKVSEQAWEESNIYTLEYQPGPLFETTEYKLTYSSGGGCGTVESNVIEVVVNSLPDSCEIIGSSELCANQSMVLYEASVVNSEYEYHWIFEHGDIMGGEFSDYCYLDVNNSSADDVLYLVQTVDSTGCSNSMSLPVSVSGELSPEQGVVIRKPGTNILVTNDSTLNINYIWGYTNKLSGIDETTESILRYSLMPHVNTDDFWYWVDTYFTDGCITRSYYNSPLLELDVHIEAEKENHLIYPNPTSGIVYFDLPENSVCELYGGGKLLSKVNPTSKLDMTSYSSGVYIIKIVQGDSVQLQKIIKL